MSDQGLTTDTAPTGAAVVGDGVPTAPAGSVEVAIPPAASTDPLAEPPVDRAVFDRGYVESIRKEAQRYRGEAQSAQRYNDVFGQYEERDQQVWLDLARTWAEDPSKAAQVMRHIASGVLGEMEQDVNQESYSAPSPPTSSLDGGYEDEELTPAKVKEMIEAGFTTREQIAAEQRAVDTVMSEVKAAGFDPDSAEGFMVLWNANHETGGDITKAAEMVKTYRQSVIDEYVQGRSSGRVAIPTQGGVQASSLPGPITNLDDARKATDAFLRERRGA